ncbi:glycosyltransferase [Rhodococcoides yunnanense]|uniref:Glycosyltransferase n=1 Tax=Rhodococcoides yunnanense TaxID=278209 RepID=A0ABU4BJB0_9NOCA|nr:glycosyltransferase [Rhodococcus yunnanensis]MDV6264289.1 glycosyltransferase [Rhodococcus yunnanensis]
MIGYYAHHHGVGHVTRADAIARSMSEPMTVLSSRTRPPGHAATEWLSLPFDVDESTDPVAQDSSAGGVLHWAPHDVDGLTERMAIIAQWVAREKPSAVVVDVSVEVSMFLRLMGVRVIVMAIPGERTDPIHGLAYRAATHIVAPWSREVYDPSWLLPYADKTTFSGSISRFAARERTSLAGDPTVVVLGAAGGTSLTRDLVDSWSAVDARFEFRALGVAGGDWIDDVWPVLCSAALVVTHAGQNAVADVAASGAPAIVVPQARPFDEQSATGRALADGSIAEVLDTWPSVARWHAVADRALDLGGARWSALRTDGAPTRAARAIEQSVLRRSRQ